MSRFGTGLGTDFRLALRRLSAAPTFLAFAVLSVGVGVGVMTASYAVLYSLLWSPPGVAEANRVAVVTVQGPLGLASWRAVVSRPDFDDLRSAQVSFAALAGSAPFADSLTSEGAAELTKIEAVTGNYFDVLGVSAAVGRTIQPSDDERQAAVVVLSDRLWRTRFGGDHGVVGRVVRIGGHPFEVIGIADASFTGVGRPSRNSPAAWIPLGATSVLARATSSNALRERRQLSVIGRLAAGRPPEQVAAEVAAIARSLDASFPVMGTSATGGPRMVRRRLWSVRLVADADEDPVSSRIGALVLCMVALVLLVACTNLGMLSLARGAVRQPELAIRRALGASRWRLVRQLLAESVVVATLGGVGALMIARALVGLLKVVLPPQGSIIYVEGGASASVLLVAAGALTVALAVIGAEPALRLTREPASAGLASGSSTVSPPGSTRCRSLPRWQAALSVCFFLLAAVLGRAVATGARHESGIAMDRLALATVHFQIQRWDETRARRAMRTTLDAARDAPGLEAVAFSSGLPFGMELASPAEIRPEDSLSPDGRQHASTAIMAASPAIFATLGVPIVLGRGFVDRDDASAPGAMVVSEHTARALFGTKNVLGRRVTLQAPGREPVERFTIVGVARDTDTERFLSRGANLVYLPLAQHYEPNVVLVGRASRDPLKMVHVLQTVLQRADPDLGVGTTGTAAQLLYGPFVAVRRAAALASGVGILALLLAMLGLYGVQSYLVARRIREFGLRMALGATVSNVERMVVVAGIRPVVEGVVLGLGLGTLARMVVRAVVAVPITVIDPLPYALVPLPVLVAALLACYLPAHRAARVDPNVALREL